MPGLPWAIARFCSLELTLPCLSAEQSSPMPARIGRLPALDPPREKVVRLLAVDDTGKCAVLPLEEHPGMRQHADEKPRLTFGKPEGRHGMHAFRANAVAEVTQAQRAHRNSS